MANQRITGHVLIIVLLLSLAMAFCAQLALEASILQIKMLAHFRSYVTLQQQLENQLLDIEKQLSRNAWDHIPAQARFIQFVPDSLAFHEAQGQEFYQIDLKKESEDGVFYHITSSFALRKPPTEINYSPNQARLASNQWVEITFEFDTHKNHTKLILKENHIDVISFEINALCYPKVYWVDPLHQGWAADAFILDMNHKLWKVDLFRFVLIANPINIPDLVLSLPIVGNDAQGIGVVYYLLTQKNNQVVLQALPSERDGTPLFVIEDLGFSAQFMLWQGLLIVYDGNNHVAAYEGFSGQLLTRSRLVPLSEPQWADLAAIRVIPNHPVDHSPWVYVPTAAGWCGAQISLGPLRLGRHSFMSHQQA